MEDGVITKRTPAFSRAVDLDAEDEEEAESARDALLNSCFLRLCPAVRAELTAASGTDGEGRLPASALIVGEGLTACGFLEAFVLGEDREMVGALFGAAGPAPGDAAANSLSQRGPGDRSAFLYRLRSNPEVLVCLCRAVPAAAQLHSWTAALMGAVDPSDVAVAILATAPAAAYRSELPPSALPLPMLRALKSSAFAGRPPCPYLEQPNLGEGLAAALLTHCQLRRVAAVAYWLFVEDCGGRPQTDDMRAFRPLLDYTPLRDCFLMRRGRAEDPERLLAQIGRHFRDASGVYT